MIIAATVLDVIHSENLKGFLKLRKRVKLIAIRFMIEAVPTRISTIVQVYFKISPRVHSGPVRRYASHTGIEKAATHRSVHASDTKNEFVTVRMRR